MMVLEEKIYLCHLVVTDIFAPDTNYLLNRLTVFKNTDVFVQETFHLVCNAQVNCLQCYMFVRLQQLHCYIVSRPLAASLTEAIGSRCTILTARGLS
jgi:hypothetical protein